MSVLIKGMEMPKKCDECHFYRYWDEMASSCRAFNKTRWIDDCDMKKERHPDCPLIEVPEHGRLIDADALENEAQMRLLECNKYDNQFQKPYEVMRAIALAPTIIPAEEGE